MSTAANIAEAALALSPADRAWLAATIIDSLPPGAVSSDEILEEACRRDDEIDSGLVREMSHSEFMAGIDHPRAKA